MPISGRKQEFSMEGFEALSRIFNFNDVTYDVIAQDFELDIC